MIVFSVVVLSAAGGIKVNHPGLSSGMVLSLKQDIFLPFFAQ